MGTPTNTPTIVVVDDPAPEPGYVDGFSVVCSDCGDVGGFSIRSMTDQHARDHGKWHRGEFAWQKGDAA